MGFFDRFKKSNKQNIGSGVNNRQPVEQLPFDIKYEINSDGNLQIECFDSQAYLREFYNIVRLIVGRQTLNIAGHQIYNCAVSWYANNDCKEIDERLGKYESRRAHEYRGVLLEIDFEQLQIDPNYCRIVMKDLLRKQSVERCLENGLEETPEKPCGKYIGGVRQTENGDYEKFFSTIVGEISHNSEPMKNRRRQYRKMQEINAQREREIKRKRAEIQELQNGLYNMEGYTH